MRSAFVIAAGAALALSGLTAAEAATLRISVTNTAAVGGFAITPVYAAVHDGSFDAFTAGQPASLGVETIAELGSPADLPAERLAADGDAVAGVVFGPTIPPLLAGESSFVDIDVANRAAQRFFTFLSMVVPSNDTFIGNDDPLAYELFDVAGVFNGPLSINVTGRHIYDAGTEVNDPLEGPAFVAGVDAMLGTDENGVVTRGVFGLADFAGIETAAGFLLDGALIDFLGDPDAFQVARIDIDVAPIPLPAGAWLLIGALGLGGLVGRRRR
ncbi:spondin domain-containing protein [Rubrimonas cliftonensis]|uniref:Spondin_N n=1 Tax=Rubrimonas cliftonensis TaxID=89524 RepID=A0A1H3XPD1_9RHOB|nr:spondin domain-containing protein [Rubrimonas cliftonensis]SEA00452.1 Spondin_N [Rubrimonas cliftonensis]